VNEVKPNTNDTLRRIGEVLDVLKRISEDLEDISTSLRRSSTPTAQAPVSGEPVAAPSAETVTSVGRGLEDVKMLFTKEMEAMLLYEDKGDFIKVTPRQYLGSDNFAKIASIVREVGGEYISAGRDSHFRIPK
jgi:hypothetical protein